MIKAIEQMLDAFIDRDVNYSTDNKYGGYCCLEGFQWYSNKDLLFLENDRENMVFYVDMNDIEDFSIDETEIDLMLEDSTTIRLWVN